MRCNKCKYLTNGQCQFDYEQTSKEFLDGNCEKFVDKYKEEYTPIIAREIFEQAFDYSTLADWYISSVDDRDTPVWTEEHIEELLNDFYVIPKEIKDGYKV